MIEANTQEGSDMDTEGSGQLNRRQHRAIMREFWEAMEDRNYHLAQNIINANRDLFTFKYIMWYTPGGMESMRDKYTKGELDHV